MMRKPAAGATTIAALSPGQVQPGLFNQPVQRGVWMALATFLVAACLFTAWNWGTLHVYRKHLMQTSPEVRVPWTHLSAEMNEAEAKALFAGLPLYCLDDATSMGQRSCYASVDKADGYPALTVVMFFGAGRLRVATLHVPWWGHDEAVETLLTQFGPSRVARTGSSTGPLRRWELQNGTIDINHHRAANVLAWSAVVWTPKRPKPGTRGRLTSV